MGIWMYLFDHDQWADLYVKNCSLKSPTYWQAAGHASIPLGMLYATFGAICEAVYIPFLLAMLKPEFIQHSCYKFMFLIGTIDLIVLPCNAMITGVQCALGAHFCTHPALFFWAGALATAGWYGVCLTCVILATDRFLEMCWPRVASIVFGGKMVYVWLVLPIVYMLFAFFHVPFLYNSRRYAYFTDPYVGIEEMHGNSRFFELTFHCIHNVSVAFLLGGIYTALIVVLKIKIMIHQHVTITKMQKLLTLQAMCICIEMFIAALVYVYNQFFPLPNFIEVIAQVSWIGVHGDTPIVYLLLNASLRTTVLKMMRISTSNNTIGNNTVGAIQTGSLQIPPSSHGSQHAIAASQPT